MADSSLPQLDPAGPLAGTEFVYLVQDGESVRVSLSTLATFIKTAESITPTALPWRGARVHRTSAITAITWPIIVSWQEEGIDTDGIWSIGDPTKLVVPAGVTKVRLFTSVQLEDTATAGSGLVVIRKNLTGTGTDTVTQQGAIHSRQSTSGFSGDYLVAETPVLEVVAGDFFDVRVNVNMVGTDQILATNRSWFQMEIVEAIP